AFNYPHRRLDPMEMPKAMSCKRVMPRQTTMLPGVMFAGEIAANHGDLQQVGGERVGREVAFGTRRSGRAQ
ncbi:hypothetical protein, partial [Mesorhizobium sp. M0408]|uniref:hypothetical protein n=1 Tax=Mesorhizobium sp. M0408 TaxID=2956942 RepID=UPI0033396028